VTRQGKGALGGPSVIPYQQHRDYVLTVLSRRCGWLDPEEREEILHEAYVVVLTKQRDGAIDIDAMAPQQVLAFLTQTAINKGLDEGKRVGRKRSVLMGEDEPTDPDPGRLPDELAAADMESARVREIVEELPDPKREIVKLRFFLERTPDEIQRALGISERVYRRHLERAVRYIHKRYERVREGSFCDDRRSMILAFVRGIAGPGRARAARAHLATCPSCASWAAELREASRRGRARGPRRNGYASKPGLPLTHHSAGGTRA
jgi:RNA polymerase sigma factor (sigma-70 family)